MIIRSISICLRCQKGGEPASKVYMITPVLHLRAASGTLQPRQHHRDTRTDPCPPRAGTH